jgi:hypothetical protein
MKLLFIIYGAPVIGIVFVIFGAMRGWWSSQANCTVAHIPWHEMTGGYLHETADGKKWVFTCKKCGRRWDA